MYRGTTPTISFTLSSDIDLNSSEQVWVTFENHSKILTKSRSDLDIDAENNVIRLQLAQEETLSFTPGEVKIQLRMLLADGNAIASRVEVTTVDRILQDGVIQ